MDGFTVVTLDPVTIGDWVFKVSANNYEEGVLVLAVNDVLGYYRCRYFHNHSEAREWIVSLESLTKEAVAASMKILIKPI